MRARALLVALALHVCARRGAAAAAGRECLAEEGGPHRIASRDFGSRSSPLAELAPFHARVHVPVDHTDGPAPCLVFVTAFAGIVDAVAYDSTFQRLASHGIAVVVLDQGEVMGEYSELGGPAVGRVVAWLQRDRPLEGVASPSPNAGFSLEGGVYMGGHSAGAHVVTFHATESREACEKHLKGFVLLSPVDGSNPFSKEADHPEDFVTSRTELLPTSTPAVIVKAEFDPFVSVMIPCAPPELANERFFDAWRGSAYFLEAKGFGHLDIMDDASSFGFACESKASEAAKATYRRAVSAVVCEFVRGVEAQDGANETLAHLAGIGPAVRHEMPVRSKLDAGRPQLQAGCVWVGSDTRALISPLTIALLVFVCAFTFLVLPVCLLQVRRARQRQRAQAEVVETDGPAGALELATT